MDKKQTISVGRIAKTFFFCRCAIKHDFVFRCHQYSWHTRSLNQGPKKTFGKITVELRFNNIDTKALAAEPVASTG